MVTTLTNFNITPPCCPFCGSPSAIEGASLEVEGCEHLMFIIAADFYIYVSDLLDAGLEKCGWTINRNENGLIDIETANDDESVDLQKAVPVKRDLVVFEQLTGPPALHSTVTAFAFFDEN